MMIQSESAIAKLRRDLAISALIRNVLLVGAFASMFIEASGKSNMIGGVGMLTLVGALWLVLSYRSVKGSRMAAASPSLIAAGDYEQAERNIEGALHSFSLFRSMKLRSLHHLAVLRHAQKRYADAAMLCRALLKHRLGAMSGLSRATKLILGDCLLELGDVGGAYGAISGMYTERLTLGEALELTLTQLDYLSRIGEWDAMLKGLRRKLELSELMPAGKSARAHAFLALAARKKGITELSNWLRMRVEALAEPADVTKERPILGEVWAVEGSNTGNG